MNHRLLTITLSASLAVGWSAGARNLTPQDFNDYVNGIAERVYAPSQHWFKSDQVSGPQRIVTKTDGTTMPVSHWSTMYTPDGEEWLYTADYEYDLVNGGMMSICAADFTIYDSHLKEYKKLRAEFQLGENETTINSVQLNPWLSKKFFNLNDAYEVMVYVHATTYDYTGHNYNQVYTLSDGSLITTIEGNNINAVNSARDSWSENFYMMFMREKTEITPSLDPNGYDDYKYTLYFDIYKKAGWGTGCTLDHTFEVDYALVSGAGNAALPILVSNNNGKVYYALPRYEKPYFASYISDEITPDNNFIIDLYDQSYNLVKTTSIPITLEDEAIYSFPGLGSFSGNDDLDFSLFTDGSGLPCYVVGVENYIISIDNFTTSLYVYDTDGNKLKTIVNNAEDYLHLNDIEGLEKQWCFLHSDAELSYFSMVNVPSCEEVAKVYLMLDGTTISTEIDRVARGTSYQYVSSILTADADEEGNAIHKLAWFDDQGEFDHYTCINLGQSIAMAMVYVAGETFNPYIFNTDDKLEYMFLVKKLRNDGTTRSDEYLRVYNEDSDLLLEIGPDTATGENLNSIFLLNPGSNDSKLVTSYYGSDLYTVRHVDLPLTKFAGGKGTLSDPYVIAQPGDLMLIGTAPSAHYVIASDLDFANLPWKGNNCVFTGSLNGNGHTISNLVLKGNGIFQEVVSTNSISNINLKDVTLMNPADESMGIIANSFISGGSKLPSLYNINVEGLTVNTDSRAYVGSLLGHAAVQTTIGNCSVSDADINAPYAVVGGFIGKAATGSAVNNSAFSGKIIATVGAGVIGESITGDEHVTNCHVTADIIAKTYAGGIVGESGRTVINNCYVDGSVSATGAKEIGAGGLVGRMAALYSDDKTITLENNVVAAKVEVNPEADRAFGHRVLGYSSGDELLVDWDSKDPNVNWEDPSTYPYVKGKPEKMLGNNYAVDVAVVDTAVADSHDSLEGKSMTMAELTGDFLANLGYKLGKDEQNPWCLVKEGLKLYFEEGASAGIQLPWSDGQSIKFYGNILSGEGAITVYDTAGVVVARGNGSVITRHLAKGVYVAVSDKGTLKFSIR